MKKHSFKLKKIFSYNIGDAIELAKASKSLALQDSSYFKLTKYSRKMLVHDAPLIVKLPAWDQEINNEFYNVEPTAKIWSFGVISLQLNFVATDKSLSEISTLIDGIEKNEGLQELAKQRAKDIAKELNESIEAYKLWDDHEDYLIIALDNQGLQLEEWKTDLYQLVEGNLSGNLSAQVKESLRAASYQYTENDLIVIDWNQALIVGDQTDLEELSMILDYALCQLLVLRFYDDLIDLKLSQVYKSIRTSKKTLFRNQYEKYAKESALLYIEFSDVLDLVSNSVKFIGDTYYAQIYRLAMQRFRVPDFFTTVKHKLTSLGEVSRLFSSEINERRNQVMELIIVLLIAVEVVPFLYNLILK